MNPDPSYSLFRCSTLFISFTFVFLLKLFYLGFAARFHDPGGVRILSDHQQTKFTKLQNISMLWENFFNYLHFACIPNILYRLIPGRRQKHAWKNIYNVHKEKKVPKLVNKRVQIRTLTLIMVFVPVLLHKHVVVSRQDEGGGNEIQIQISSCNMFNKKIWKRSLFNLKSILTNVWCYSQLHTFLYAI